MEAPHFVAPARLLNVRATKDVYPTQHQSNYKIIVNGKVGAHSVPKGADGRPGFFMSFAQGNMGILFAFILIPFVLCLANSINKNLRIAEL